MKNELNRMKIISLLLLLVFLTAFAAISFTFAGNSQEPDTTVVYTRNKLTWDVDTKNGIAQLNIFDKFKDDTGFPLISPMSEDVFDFRIKNNVQGDIRYYIYLYTDLDSEVPIKFDISNIEEVKEIDLIPNDLKDYKLLSAFGGKIGGKKITDMPIKWYWDSESDIKDTFLGDKAVEEDIFCNVYMQIVIEDNNIYSSGSTNTSEGVVTIRLLHRDYIKGYPDNTFGPEKNITREEVSAIFSRIMSNFEDDKIVGKNTSFNDLNKDDWSYRYISTLENMNIIKGYEDGSFKPKNNISRAEFITICVRYYENKVEKINTYNSDFIDIKDGYWANDYISKGSTIGLIKGYEDNTFRPEQNITRSEAVTIINRLLSRNPDKEFIDKNINNIKQFNDVKDKSYWAYYDIYEASTQHFLALNTNKEIWVSAR